MGAHALQPHETDPAIGFADSRRRLPILLAAGAFLACGGEGDLDVLKEAEMPALVVTPAPRTEIALPTTHAAETVQLRDLVSAFRPFKSAI